TPEQANSSISCNICPQYPNFPPLAVMAGASCRQDRSSPNAPKANTIRVRTILGIRSQNTLLRLTCIPPLYTMPAAGRLGQPQARQQPDPAKQNSPGLTRSCLVRRIVFQAQEAEQPGRAQAN